MYQHYSENLSQNQQSQSGLEFIVGVVESQNTYSNTNSSYTPKPRAGPLATALLLGFTYLGSLLSPSQIDSAYADGGPGSTPTPKASKNPQAKHTPVPHATPAKKKASKPKSKKTPSPSPSPKPTPETYEHKVERPRLINTEEGYQNVNIRAYPPAELVQDPNVISGQRLVDYLKTQDPYKKDLWDEFVIKTAKDYYNKNKAYCDNKLGVTDFSGFEKLLNETKGVQLVSDKTNHRIVFTVNSNKALHYQVSIVNGQVRSRGLQFFVIPMDNSAYDEFDEAAGKLHTTFQKEKQDQENKLLTAAKHSNILIVQRFDPKSLSDEQRIALGIAKNDQLNNSTPENNLYQILNINDPVFGYASRDLHDRKITVRPIKGTEAVNLEAVLITYGTNSFELSASLRSTQSMVGEPDLILQKGNSVSLELKKVEGLAPWILDTINLNLNDLKNTSHLLYDANPRVTLTPLKLSNLNLRTDVVTDSNVLNSGFPIDFIIGMFGGNGIGLGQYDRLVKTSHEFSLNYTISMQNNDKKLVPYDPQSIKILLEPKPVNLRKHSGEGLLYSILGSLLISNGTKNIVNNIFTPENQTAPNRAPPNGENRTAPSRSGGSNRLWTPSNERLKELNLQGFVDYNGLLIPEKINASVDEQKVLKDLGIGKKRIKKNKLSLNEKISYELTLAMRKKRLEEITKIGIHLTQEQIDSALENITYRISA